jgi:replicative superfamily II helicase
MTKAEERRLRRELEKTKRLLEAERERSGMAFKAYGDALSDYVIAKLALDEIREILKEVDNE